jgi:Helix-turn-helix domain
MVGTDMQLQANRKTRRGAAALRLNVESLTPAELEQVQDAIIERVRVRILPDSRMDRDNAALYLGVSRKTLDQWAYQGKGPRCVKVGGGCFYFKADLDAFIRGAPEAA